MRKMQPGGPKIIFDKELKENQFAFCIAVVNYSEKIKCLADTNKVRLIRDIQRKSSQKDIRIIEIKVLQVYEKTR